MDSTLALLSLISTTLSLGLTYYSVRTIALFKGSVAARAWVYISISAVFFSTGLVALLIDSIMTMGLIVLGGALMTIGGMFLFLGLRKNFLFWASKDHFT